MSMAVDVVFESEGNFGDGPRPKVAYSSRYYRKNAEQVVANRCANAEDRDIKGQKLSTYHLIDSDSKELFLYNNPASPHRKSMPSRSMGIDVRDSGELKRGSVYQSSRDVRRMQKLRDGQRNVKQDLNDDTFLSFEVIDSSSWCSSYESVHFPQSNKDPLLALNVEAKSPSVANIQSVSTKNMDFLDLSFRDLPEERLKISISCLDANPAYSSSADSLLGISLQTEEINSLFTTAVPELVEKVQVTDIKCVRHQLLDTGVDAHIIHDKDAICILPKSFSAKLEISNSSYHSEREIMKSSRRTRFSPFKKMLDPIMKSKSLRNPSVMELETSSSSASDAASLGRYKIFPRSLLNDLSKATQKIDNDRESSGSDQIIKTATSPAHLHAILKWEFDHGGPSYEFSVKNPEDVLCAKTWKSENAFNWVYTFHCCKSNSISRGTKDMHVHPSLMIGQMQVSCYLCSEVSEAGSFKNSAVTEFTLYDIAQARRSMAFERPHHHLDSNLAAVFTAADTLVAENPSETNTLMETEKHQHPVQRNSSDYDTDPSASYPWASTELHPHLEIAAIVIQIPFSKKEALKNMQMRDIDNSGYEGLFIAPAADQERGTFVSHPSSADVKVVTPSGRHGLPYREEVGPSSLLNRWRFGGGCDCGGWDMGCPIVVFDTANDYNAASATGTQQPIVLFVMGKKEKIPALTITANGKGQYAVDFHAQLSALQAFSICIAVLHSSEASSAIGRDKNKHKLYSNSLKLLLEEEVRHIIEAVAEEEKRKAKKRVEQVPPSFFLDPPFSPMGRV